MRRCDLLRSHQKTCEMGTWTANTWPHTSKTMYIALTVKSSFIFLIARNDRTQESTQGKYWRRVGDI